MIGDKPTPTASARSPCIVPYSCGYCGWVTEVPSEAGARLCVRCVRFEGDVHPAMTGARISAHSARIMGMIKNKD